MIEYKSDKLSLVSIVALGLYKGSGETVMEGTSSSVKNSDPIQIYVRASMSTSYEGCHLNTRESDMLRSSIVTDKPFDGESISNDIGLSLTDATEMFTVAGSEYLTPSKTL